MKNILYTNFHSKVRDARYTRINTVGFFPDFEDGTLVMNLKSEEIDVCFCRCGM